MRSEIDTLIAVIALSAVVVGLGLEFGVEWALIVGGLLTFAAIVAIKRASA